MPANARAGPPSSARAHTQSTVGPLQLAECAVGFSLTNIERERMAAIENGPGCITSAVAPSPDCALCLRLASRQGVGISSENVNVLCIGVARCCPLMSRSPVVTVSMTCPVALGGSVTVTVRVWGS